VRTSGCSRARGALRRRPPASHTLHLAVVRSRTPTRASVPSDRDRRPRLPRRRRRRHLRRHPGAGARIPMRMNERGQMEPLSAASARARQGPLRREPMAAIVADDRYRAEDALATCTSSTTRSPRSWTRGPLRATDPAALRVGRNEHGRAPTRSPAARRPRVTRGGPRPGETFYVQAPLGRPLGPARAGRVGCRPRRAEHVGDDQGAARQPAHTSPSTRGCRAWRALPADDVGGAFGVRGEVYPEDFLVALLALRTRRRTLDRGPPRAPAATNHSREQHHEIAIGLRRDGTILASTTGCEQHGRLRPTHGATAPNNTAAYIPGPYRVPHYRPSHCVVTNKTPAGNLRAPGRFEATFVRERLVDHAARALAMDPAEIRRRKFHSARSIALRPSAPPPTAARSFTTAATTRGCSGGARPRGVRHARQTPKRRRAGPDATSIGLAYGWRSPARPLGVRAASRRRPVTSSSTPAIPSAQGVETVFAQVCADILSVRYEDVTVRTGTPMRCPTASEPSAAGEPSWAATPCGLRPEQRARQDPDRGRGASWRRTRPILELRDGAVHVRGVADRALSLREVARAATVTRALPGAWSRVWRRSTTTGKKDDVRPRPAPGRVARSDARPACAASFATSSPTTSAGHQPRCSSKGRSSAASPRVSAAALHEEARLRRRRPAHGGTLMEYHLPAAADMARGGAMAPRGGSPRRPIRSASRAPAMDGIVAAGGARSQCGGRRPGAPGGVEIRALPFRPSRLKEPDQDRASTRRIIHLDMDASTPRSSSATGPSCAAGPSPSAATRAGGGGGGLLRGADLRRSPAMPMSGHAGSVPSWSSWISGWSTTARCRSRSARSWGAHRPHRAAGARRVLSRCFIDDGLDRSGRRAGPPPQGGDPERDRAHGVGPGWAPASSWRRSPPICASRTGSSSSQPEAVGGFLAPLPCRGCGASATSPSAGSRRSASRLSPTWRRPIPPDSASCSASTGRAWWSSRAAPIHARCRCRGNRSPSATRRRSRRTPPTWRC